MIHYQIFDLGTFVTFDQGEIFMQLKRFVAAASDAKQELA